ncbi:MAG: hypothetical protein H6739_21815 [Alphaproteobacteria bacterium]|nr:hypothetical protein [Alphaproteobacteria bacterium]
MTRTAMLALAVLGGCKGILNNDGDDSGSDSGGTPVDEFSPRITEPDAFCYEHTEGDTFFQWIITASVTDPQGDDTLDVWATLEVLAGGGVVYDIDAVVDKTAGTINTSFNADTAGINCDAADTYTFRLTARDSEGNEGTAEVAGRRQ